MQRSPEEFKNLRLSLGWTTSEMTRRLGCSKEALLAYESGDQTPDQETINQYEGLFSVHEEQSRRHRIRPIADHLLQVENLQQVDQDSLGESDTVEPDL